MKSKNGKWKMEEETMSKKTQLITNVCKYVNAALMVALISLQFIPFWDMGEIGKLSIADYMWFPYKYKGADAFLKKAIAIDWYYINDTVTLGIILFILCAVGVVLCIFTKKFIASLFPVAAGVVGILWFLTRPEMQMGENWVLHLIPCVLMIVVAVISLVVQIKEVLPKKN